MENLAEDLVEKRQLEPGAAPRFVGKIHESAHAYRQPTPAFQTAQYGTYALGEVLDNARRLTWVPSIDEIARRAGHARRGSDFSAGRCLTWQIEPAQRTSTGYPPSCVAFTD